MTNVWVIRKVNQKVTSAQDFFLRQAGGRAGIYNFALSLLSTSSRDHQPVASALENQTVRLAASVWARVFTCGQSAGSLGIISSLVTHPAKWGNLSG